MDEGFRSFLTRGQIFLEELFEAELIWDGVTYVCANSGARMGDELEDGGFVESGSRNVRVLKERMGIPPLIGDLLTLNGEEVRLIEVGDRPWDVSWHLQLSPVRGQ